MYTPDRAFMARLKAEDPKLGCHWNGKHFVITYARPSGPPAVIWVVMPDEGQEFRQPDQRDLDAIIASDTRRESPREKHQRVSKYMADFRANVARVRRENIRNMAKDNKVQIFEAYNQFVGIGKGKSAFRRIELKPNKNTVTVSPTVPQ